MCLTNKTYQYSGSAVTCRKRNIIRRVLVGKLSHNFMADHWRWFIVQFNLYWVWGKHKEKTLHSVGKVCLQWMFLRISCWQTERSECSERGLDFTRRISGAKWCLLNIYIIYFILTAYTTVHSELTQGLAGHSWERSKLARLGSCMVRIEIAAAAYRDSAFQGKHSSDAWWA